MSRELSAHVVGQGKLGLLTVTLCLLGVGCAPSENVDLFEETTSDLSFENLPGQSTPYLYDWGTLCTGDAADTHCCPGGMVMVGAHLQQNVFKCAMFQGGLGNGVVDYGRNPTVRNGMHTCP